MYHPPMRAVHNVSSDTRHCTEHLRTHRSVSKLRVDVTRPAVSYQACALQAMNARASIAGYDTCARAICLVRPRHRTKHKRFLSKCRPKSWTDVCNLRCDRALQRTAADFRLQLSSS